MAPVPVSRAAAQDEITLASLHQQRSTDELLHELTYHLAQMLPEVDVVLLLATEHADTRRVAIVLGNDDRALVGANIRAGSLVVPPYGSVLKLRYLSHDLGELLVFAALGEQRKRDTDRLLRHAAIAFANLQLNSEALDSADGDCLALQVLEEGIGLFQETDPEAISARFLSLAGSVLGSQFGAILLAERIGVPDAPLRLDQALGIPEQLLLGLHAPDGRWWPETLPRTTVAKLDRDADGSLGGLDPASLPDVLRNVVVCPLAYHGISTGICVIANAACSDEAFEARLESLRRLGELGGALFHRLALEREALLSKSLETQLKIAAEIQKHLMPSVVPAHPRLQFAYRSRPAQHVGGDYVDLLRGPDSQTFAIVADVAGHGINSALLMSSLRSSYRAAVEHREPSELFAWLNQNVVDEVADTGMFLTAASFVLPAEPDHATFVGAGHNPVLIWRSGTRTLEELLSLGPPLGVARGAHFEPTRIPLAKGDVILLYTDGVPECWSPDGQEMFGGDALRRVFAANAHRAAADIQQALLAALERFNPREWNDDVSLCVIKAH